MRTSQFRFCALILSTLALSACALHSVALPLPDTQDRATPLHFGVHVEPNASNPIQPPERFSGYHVGTDFEVSADELEKEIPVSAVCTGTILYSGFAEGYGGVVLQHCLIQNVSATVIYGHLTIEGLPAKGVRLNAGDQISTLGAAKSHDTDGNRKHLHLGIRLGTSTDMRGYVQTTDELSEYLDAQIFLPPSHGTGGAVAKKPYWKQ